MSDELTPADFAEINRKLAYIGPAAVGVCRVAARAGAKVLSVKLQAASPVYDGDRVRKRKGKVLRPGAMKRSIGFGSIKPRGQFIVGAKTGFDVGKKNRTDESGSHGHLFIHGTAMRWRGFVRDRGRGKTKFALTRTKNAIRYTGAAQPHLPSFIKSTTASSSSEVLKAVADSVRIGLEKAITKQGG